MCLGRIIKPTIHTEGIGYKVFATSRDGTKITAPIRDFTFIEDAWLLYKEPTESCSCSTNPFRLFLKNYKHAFHIFKDIGGARQFQIGMNLRDKFNMRRSSLLVVREVLYKKYIAEDKDVLVAEEIMLPSGQQLISIPCAYYYGSTFNSIMNGPVENGGMGPGYQYNSTLQFSKQEAGKTFFYQDAAFRVPMLKPEDFVAADRRMAGI